MARGSRLVNAQQIVEDVIQFNVAKDGKIYGIDAGYVVCDGVIRQFWPRDLPDTNPIVMSVSDAISYDIKAINQGEPEPICQLDVRTGYLIFSNPDGTTWSEAALAPPPRGTGVYLWKFDIVSGNIVADDPAGSWVDVYSEGSLGVKLYSLPNTTRVPGQILGEGLITLAKDDGGGSPEAGTEVSKSVYFISEITGQNFVLSGAPWELTDERINETAYVSITVGSDGVLYGYVHGVQVISETWALNPGENFSVQVNPKGDTLIGDATNTWLDISKDRIWRLTTGAAETADVDNSITLLMRDGVRQVSKQIVLRARRSEEQAESEISDDWTQYDWVIALTETYLGVPADATATFFFNSDGTLTCTTEENSPPFSPPSFPQNWNNSAPNVPDPENFEIRCTLVSGDFPLGSDPLDVWMNLSSNRRFYLNAYAQTNVFGAVVKTQNDCVLLFEIREVGRPEIIKSKTLRIRATAICYGPGAQLP